MSFKKCQSRIKPFLKYNSKFLNLELYFKNYLFQNKIKSIFRVEIYKLKKLHKMKKKPNETLSLKKFTVAKLNNLSHIYGGDAIGGDGGQGETITNDTAPPPTQRPTQEP